VQMAAANVLNVARPAIVGIVPLPTGVVIVPLPTGVVIVRRHGDR